MKDGKRALRGILARASRLMRDPALTAKQKLGLVRDIARIARILYPEARGKPKETAF